MTFHGGHAYIGEYNLTLQGKQYSLSGIWVQNGPPSDLNSIFVGLGVNPDLYGDSKLHITARWTAGRSGCYNYDCPGFVQVGSEKVLGDVESDVSTIGAIDKMVLATTIKQDKSTGHWWLCFHKKPECFGYWPKELFSHLSSGASMIRFGGETYSPTGEDSPPMGSGRLPQEKYRNSGFMLRVEILNSEYNEIDVLPKNMKINKGGNLNCYDLLYRGDEGLDIHQSFLYGGPGGKLC
ncbi:protein neprosin-like [Vicia villosa]|uniref:protein neprosin-like n=1 Tax=Vicia villosa TaxID=3911 RepID=UPI00273AF0CA|nr:protein neprosin-like [Vicia villosa]